MKELFLLLEAIFFISTEPLKIEKLHRFIQKKYPHIDQANFEDLLSQLESKYLSEEYAFFLLKEKRGYRFCVKSPFVDEIARFHDKKPHLPLSNAQLEVAAIIAYRGAITLSAIESIRGVDSSAALHNLLEKELIKTAGRASTPGRPYLYKVSRDFFPYFGIKSVDDLPKISFDGHKVLKTN